MWSKGDTYLTSMLGVIKAEKEKMIATLVRGSEVIWGELTLVRVLLAAGWGEGTLRENMGNWKMFTEGPQVPEANEDVEKEV